LAIIPGVTGQKAELFDGAKIDAISEYTAGNGTQLQGRTNGVAIEAGKVGEVGGPYTAVIASVNATYVASGNLVNLSPGRWALWVTASTAYSATNTAIVFGAAVNNNAANNAGMDTGTGTGSFNTQYSGNSGTGAGGTAGPYFVDVAISTPIYVKVYNSGTNINVPVTLKTQRIA
jgi:hypothetical protein